MSEEETGREHGDQNIGLKLKAFRESRGYKQSEIAEILWPGEKDEQVKANYVRRVSFIENRRRPLKPVEYGRLIKQYEDFASFRPNDVSNLRSSRGTVRAIDSEGFIKKQQDFLTQPQNIGRYDLWLFNGQVQPVQDFPEYRDSWKTNLSRGSDYYILWDLRPSPSRNQEFLEFVKKLSGIAASDLENNNQGEIKSREDVLANPELGSQPAPDTIRGRINIFPYVLDSKTWDSSINELITALRKEQKQIGAGVDIWLPFACWGAALDNVVTASSEAMSMLIYCYQAAASTVVYLPKVGNPTLCLRAATEPPDVPDSFGEDVTKKNQHLLYDESLILPMVSSITDFYTWAKSKLSSF